MIFQYNKMNGMNPCKTTCFTNFSAEKVKQFKQILDNKSNKITFIPVVVK
jgi:hypothetical protein